MTFRPVYIPKTGPLAPLNTRPQSQPSPPTSVRPPGQPRDQKWFERAGPSPGARDALQKPLVPAGAQEENALVEPGAGVLG